MEIYYAFNGFLEGNVKYCLQKSYESYVKKHTPKYSDGQIVLWCMPKQIKPENIDNLVYDRSETGPSFVYVQMDCYKPTSSGEKFDHSTLSCILNMQNFSMKKTFDLLRKEVDWDKDAYSVEPG